ncbi:tail fiber protein, partial [Klebsiella aerogenes]
ATNDFLSFATGSNANVTPQSDWKTLPAVTSGFTSGKASSAQVNKAIRQATFIASGLAQFVSDTLLQDILDNGNSAAFVTALKQAIVNGSVPAGIPMPWPAETPPAGWLKCNGANFNTSTYPLLAKAYPAGKLPDLRG